MSLRRLFSANPKATSHDSERLLDKTESSDSLSDTLGVNYIYYRVYAEDGAIPSKTPASPSNPFLGRIKATSVSPPHTVKTLRCSIAKVEDIKDPNKTSLFLTPYSQSPVCDTDKVILNRNGLGSTPQEPLALVARISDSKRSAFESEVATDSHWHSVEPDTTQPAEIRYLYYLLYSNDYEKPSKVAIDPENPSLGRIRADSVAPPHSLATLKRCISRAEGTPALVHADIFLDISSDTPLKEGPISILGTDCPGLRLKTPMAIALDPSLPDGRYIIKNRAADIYWSAVPVHYIRVWTVRFRTLKFWQKMDTSIQWDITHDSTTNGGTISMKSCADKWWSAVDSKSMEIKSSNVPIPWRLIRVDSKFYYVTSTKVNSESRVAAAQPGFDDPLMATLKEGDPWQMWEFIRI